MSIRPSQAALRLIAALCGSMLFCLAADPGFSAEEWLPPEPETSKWDWARIDSDEWIKGELLVVQSKKMLFDSDEFDEVEIDWEDVKDLRLAHPRVFRLTGNRLYAGMGELRDGILRVRTADGEVVEIPAGEVVSITYTPDSRLRLWTVRIGANLATRSGNTDQQDIGGNALFRRDSTYTRWETRYNGAFGSVDGEQTTNNHRATTNLDFMVTNHFFVRIPSFEFYADEFQNIDARYTPGAGIGYEPIDTPMVLFRVTLGGAAQITDFDGGTRATDAAVLAGSELAFDFPRDVDLDLRYSLQLLVTDIGRTAHSTSGVLSFSVWDPIDLDVGAYWDRIEQPQRDGDGDKPKSDDFRLTVGLSIDF